MFRHITVIVIYATLIFTLAACSSFPVSSLNTSLSSTLDASTISVENKLGIGILMLEKTSQAVTSDQARELLPLWKAVKSLSSNSDSSTVEISALYDQIRETLNEDQIQTIRQLTWTQEEFSGLVQQAGGSSEARNSSGSGSSSQGGQSQAGGGAGMMGPAGGGMPGGDMMMGDMGGMGGPEMQGGSAQSQQASQVSKISANSADKLNSMFAESVITLLKQRINV